MDADEALLLADDEEDDDDDDEVVDDEEDDDGPADEGGVGEAAGTVAAALGVEGTLLATAAGDPGACMTAAFEPVDDASLALI
jgi:hypothetical protein